MKIKRKLPDPPRPATRATFKKEVVGDGKYTRTIDRPQKLHMTPGKWPRSAPKRRAKKQTELTPNKATARRLENTKKVLELYDKGYTSDQIVCETGLARTTVDRYIRTERGRRYRMQFQHDAEIIEMYEDGVKIDEIGRRLDVPSYYVLNVLKRLHTNYEVGWRNKGWEEKALSE